MFAYLLNPLSFESKTLIHVLAGTINKEFKMPVGLYMIRPTYDFILETFRQLLDNVALYMEGVPANQY